MTRPRYYLSSLDSYSLEAVRVCEFVGVKRFDTGKECILVEVFPPIPGGPFGLGFDVREVVLAARHQGVSLTNIREFPCFVHVARAATADVRNKDVLLARDLENLAWGELYRSRSDAERHIFDRTK